VAVLVFVSASRPASTQTSVPTDPLTIASEAWYAEAEEVVRSEVRYADHTIKGSRGSGLSPFQREMLTAMSAVRHVSTRLSSLHYGDIIEIEGRAIPTTDNALEEGAGICGNHALASISLLRRLGLKVRSAQFYRAGPRGHESHIVVEVLVGDAWRMLDVTWNTWFLRNPSDPFDLVSVADLIANGRASYTMRTDTSSPLVLVSSIVSGDVISYLDAWPNKVVLVGQVGRVSLLPDRDGRWTPTGVPNFIGRTHEEGELAEGSVSVILKAAERPAVAALQLTGVAAACRDGLIEARAPTGATLASRSIAALSADGRFPLTEVAVSGQEIVLNVTGPPNESCYIVYEKIEASP
jgi:hypothetical protein